MRRFTFLAIAPLCLVLLYGCKTPPPPVTSQFDAQKLHELDNTIVDAVGQHRCPGAVLWLERNGVAYHKAYGQRAVEPVVEQMTEDTIFDAASLTKVIATTPSIMLLIERGQIDLDAPVNKYIEEFRRDGKESITVRHLMTHTSGLRAGLSPQPSGTHVAIQMACRQTLLNPIGTKFLYSDINYILLGEIVHRVSGRPLEMFAAQEVFQPLMMKDTGYLPLPEERARIAPTEREGTNILRGVVHDPTARRMDRVAGHAGVFTTAADLARFARMMLNQGELDGVRVLKPETVRLMTSVQSPPAISNRRGLGWDIDTAYSGPRGSLFPIGSYGHTGFTGTAMWIDPFSKTFVILMTNSVHPDRKGDVRGLRRAVGTLAAEAVRGFDFNNVTGALPGTNQMSSVR
ncbi:MAG TPA: serine hydrolase domain-containing protein [Candidatus Acidoferrum sp.]|nr:serine hydrolase domain-containing protein [Candidatus Acidoferrum sp.]